MPKQKSKILVISALFAVSLLAGCGGGESSPASTASAISSAKSDSKASDSKASDSKANYYTVRWLNDDGSVLEVDQNVLEGTDPHYDGATPSKTNPQPGMTYTFAGWTPTLAKVTKNIDYTATYRSAETAYTITWSIEGQEVLETYHYGERPTYKGETPTKADTEKYSYTFVGWTPNIQTVTADATYYALFEQETKQYPISWVVEGRETKIERVAYGEMPAYQDETAVYDEETGVYEPTRPESAQYSYKFLRWEPTLSVVNQAATYTAVFASTVNTYTVTWDVDGQTTSAKYEYGETPVYSGATPSKESTAQYDYSFAGWDKEIGPVTEDVTYVATFDETVRQYTVTWDVEGEKTSAKFDYGTMPSYGEEDPTKQGDEATVYVFTGWNPAVSEVTGDIEYKAQFSAETRKYKISFVEKEGTVEKEVPYGTVPTYRPKDIEDEEFIYVFSGFEEELVAVTGEATYHATYTKYDRASIEALSFSTYSDQGCCATLNSGAEIAELNIPAYYKGYKVIRVFDLERNTSLEKVVLPDTLEQFPSFSGCTNLKTVEVPEMVKGFNFASTFNGCELLETNDFGNVRYLGRGANPYHMAVGVVEGFAEKSITLHKDAVLVNNRAFPNLGLEEFHYSDKVKYFGIDAFAPDRSSYYDKYTPVTDVYYDGDLESYLGIEFDTELGEGGNYGTSYSNPIYKCEHFHLGENEVVDLVIPESVTEIKKQAFWGLSSLRTVTMHDGVTALGTNCFANCENLQSAKLSAAIEVLPFGAFSRCYSLHSVNLPEEVTEIKGNAFLANFSLTTITLPKKVKSISNSGFGAFYGCYSLYEVVNHSELALEYDSTDNGYVAYYALGILENEEDSDIVTENGFVMYRMEGHDILLDYVGNAEDVVIPESVTVIGQSAFARNEAIKSVTLHQNISIIGNSAFALCPNLEKVVWDVAMCSANVNYNPSYPDDGNWQYWFEGCPKLQTFEIGEHATSLPVGLFRKSDIKDVVIPDTVTKIGSNAFERAASLRSVFIGSGVTEWGENLFQDSKPVLVFSKSEGCADATITYQGEGEVYTVDDAFLLVKENDVVTLLTYYGEGTEVVLPSNIDVIGEKAFRNNEAITSVTFSEGISEIGDSAFEGCSNLAEVKLNANLETIGDSAFKKCTSLAEIKLNENLKDIGASAFNGSGLEAIVIPDKVENIGAYAFYASESLKDITIGEGVTYIGQNAFNLKDISVKYNAINVEKYGDTKEEKDYSGAVLLVTYYPFGGNSQYSSETRADINELIIGEKVTTIPAYAFSNYDIPSLIIPDSVTSIGTGAFYANHSLTSLTLGKGIDVVSNMAFSNCTKLTAVDIPSNVKYIEVSAFSGCTALAEVTFHEGLESIRQDAFRRCTSIVSLTLPDSLTTIGNGAFYGDYSSGSALTAIHLGKNVTAIGESAFAHNSSLTTFTHYEKLTKIGKDAFYNATGFEKNSFAGGQYTGNEENPYLILWSVPATGGVEIPASCYYIRANAFRYKVFAYYDGTVEDWCGILLEDYTANPMYANSTSRIYFLDENGDIEYGEHKYSFVTDLVIPEGVTEIRAGQFYRYPATSIRVAGTAKSIGTNAFYYGTATTIILEEGVESIAANAFASLSGLVTVSLPKSLTKVGNYNFNQGQYDYDRENKIETIYYGGSAEEWLAISFGSNGNPASSAYLKNFYVRSDDGEIVFDGKKYDAVKEIVVDAKILNDSSLAPFTDLESIYFDGTVEDFLTGNVRDPDHLMNHATKFYVRDEEGTVEKGGKKYSLLTDLVVPESVTKINYKQFYNFDCLESITLHDGVTSIGNYTFYGCDNLKTVTLGEGLAEIGTYAFYNCKSLTEITIPEGVTTIKQKAFQNCSALEKAALPATVLTVEEAAFDGCAALQSVDLSSVTDIGIYAFSGCIKLEAVTFGADLTFIGDYAFEDCYGLASITIPDAAIEIAPYAFKNCTGLLQADLGTSVVSIGEGAFSGCQKMERVTFSGTLTKIGVDAFEFCYALLTIEIPDTVTEIGESAFYYNSSLTRITLGSGLTTIGSYAFYNDKQLYEVVNHSGLTLTKGGTDNGYVAYYAKDIIEDEADSKLTVENGLMIYDGTELIRYVGEGGDVVIPDTVTQIDKGAFKGCDTVTSVKMGDEVTSIGDDAFRDCKALKTIVLSKKLETLGTYAYYGCASLESIAFPETLTAIPYFAFGYCDSLQNIEFSSSIAAIRQDAFYGCKALTYVFVPSTITNIDYDAFGSCGKAVFYCEAASQPNAYSWAWFGQYNNNRRAIWGAVKGEEPVIVDGYELALDKGKNTATIVYYRGEETEIVIPATFTVDAVSYKATAIGQDAFIDNDVITSIVVGENVTTIGNYAFGYMKALRYVFIPDSVSEVSSIVAYSYGVTIFCAHSKQPYSWSGFNDNNPVLYSMTKEDKPIVLGNFVYYATSASTVRLVHYIGTEEEIVVPSSIVYNEKTYDVTEIGEYAFYHNREWHLTSLTFEGNKLTSIGDNAFAKQFELQSVTFGEGLTTIGKRAFDGCKALTGLVFSESLVSIGDGAFYECAALTEINLPDNVTTIGDEAFRYCQALATLTLGKKVQTIGSGTFINIDVTSVIIPASVTAIDSYAFSDSRLAIYCEATSKPAGWDENWHGNSVIIIWGVEPGYEPIVVSGMEFAIEEGKASLLRYVGEGGDVVVPSTITTGGKEYDVTKIYASAFSGDNGVTSVSIPDSVTEIGTYLFGANETITSVTVGKGITAIPLSTFVNAKNLKEVTFAGDIVSIGDDAFKGCAALKEFAFPATLESIGQNAFSESGIVKVVLPDTVTSIGQSAFYGCLSLTSVTLGKGITSIPNNAFQQCKALQEIKFLGDVTSFGNYVFYYCSSLRYLYLPSSAVTIGTYFLSNASDKCIIFAEAAEKPAGWSSSWNVKDLTVIYNANKEMGPHFVDDLMYLIVDENTVTLQGNYSSEQNLTIPDKVTIDGKEYQVASVADKAGYVTYNLYTLTTGEALKTIGMQSFYNCYNLYTLNLGTGITTIGDSAFASCRSLRTINYAGTMEEWGKISLGENWKQGTSYYLTSVVCSDGTVDL